MNNGEETSSSSMSQVVDEFQRLSTSPGVHAATPPFANCQSPPEERNLTSIHYQSTGTPQSPYTTSSAHIPLQPQQERTSDDIRQAIELDHEIRRATAYYDVAEKRQRGMIDKLFKCASAGKKQRTAFAELWKLSQGSPIYVSEGLTSVLVCCSQSPASFRNECSHTLLHHAAAKTEMVEIITLLVSELDIPVDITDLCGRTALHIAAQNASLDNVKELLNLGANPWTTDVLGYTPLNYVRLKFERISESDRKKKEGVGGACEKITKMLIKFDKPSHELFSAGSNGAYTSLPSHSPLKSVLGRSLPSPAATPPQATNPSGSRLLTARHQGTPFEYAMSRIRHCEDIDSQKRSLLDRFQSVARNADGTPMVCQEDDENDQATQRQGEEDREFHFVLLLVDSRHPLLTAPHERLRPKVVLKKIPYATTRTAKEIISSACRSATAPFRTFVGPIGRSEEQRKKCSPLSSGWEPSYVPALFIGPIDDIIVAQKIATAWHKKNQQMQRLRQCAADCDTDIGFKRNFCQPSKDTKLWNSYQEAIANLLKCSQKQGIGPCEYSAVHNGIKLLSRSGTYSITFSTKLEETNFWNELQQLKKSYAVTIPYLDPSNSKYKLKRRSLLDSLCETLGIKDLTDTHLQSLTADNLQTHTNVKIQAISEESLTALADEINNACALIKAVESDEGE